MKKEIVNINFKIAKKGCDSAMNIIKNYCEANNIVYTYIIKNEFYRYRAKVESTFEGEEANIERLLSTIESFLVKKYRIK